MKDVYKSREFCKSIECLNQKLIDDFEKIIFEIPRKERIDSVKNHCKKCKAWIFHDWLQKNGYIIVKEDQIKQIEEVIENADDLREALVILYHSGYSMKHPERLNEFGD